MPGPIDATPDTRGRILAAAGRQFRQHGFAATGIKAILTESRAPYGSLYHHFPGGKTELGVATIAEGGRVYRELVEAFFTDRSQPFAGCVVAFFHGAAELLEATDFHDACPVATIALEVANTNEPMRQAAAEAFEGWIEVLVARLEADGRPTDEARRLAVTLFCAVEGAFLLARTTRSAAPLHQAAEAMVALLAG